MKNRMKFAVAAAAAVAVASPAFAVPYASGVRNTAGASWEFVLNESADNVTILRNGGSALNLGTLPAGRHTFDMTGFTSFNIEVAKDVPKAWTAISDVTNLFTRFEQPAGLAVNKNPASPYFGTIYVNNSRSRSTVLGSTGGELPMPIPVRAMGEGIYSLTSDMIGVDLSSPSWVVPESDDTSQARKPNWVTDTREGATNTSTETVNGARSAWRIALDNAGNLIATDYSLLTGGIKWASPNLTQGGRLLAGDNNSSTNGVQNGQGQFTHSRIVSKPNVTGTLGVDLTVTAIDSDLEAVPGSATVDGQNIWRWNLGNHNPSVDGEFTGAPKLIINGASLGGFGAWITTVAGVSADVHYSPQHDLYYLTQPRSNGSEASLLIVRSNEDPNAPPNTPPAAPTVLFNSRTFSTTNGLDGAVDYVGTTLTGVQDIFRMAGSVELSADGKSLYVRRQQVMASTATGTGNNENPVLGTGSNNPYGVLILPLDANGLPVLTIDTKGTPETTDDRLGDLDGFSILSQASQASNYEIELDAAGNAYTTNSFSEVLQVFSPGGNTKAVTSWNGTTMSFTVGEVGVGLAGDFNNDNTVDGADFLSWQRGNSPGNGSQADLALWKANFGTSAATPAAAAVPEPASLSLVGVGLAGLMAAGRRYGRRAEA